MTSAFIEHSLGVVTFRIKYREKVMASRDIHLVGSIPLADAAEVFSMVAGKLGGYCKRLPDGETGDRLTWIRWQDHVFRDHPQLDAIESAGDYRNATAVVQSAAGTKK